MSATWINQLNQSDSRLHKEEVLSKVLVAATLGSKEASNFLKLVRYTYNPLITFGIKQVPESEGITGAENPWEEFTALLSKLNARWITGNAARNEIEGMMARFDSEEWNLLCRAVITKDLRCGISDKTINKVVKGTEYVIPVFGCQLATSCEDRPEMKGTKRLEPKLDGVRALFTVIPGASEGVTVVCFSRNGKVFENFSHIEEQISKNYGNIVRACIGAGIDQGRGLVDGFVLDGEVIGNSFQELMKQARRKENAQAEDSVFTVFDIIPLTDFHRGHWNAPLRKRIELLDAVRTVVDTMPNVELLPHIMVDLDTAAGKDQLERYAKDNVDAGFEGIMIKDMGAPYICKRSTDWLKWKPTISVDLTVIELAEGTGRNKNKLGALICEGMDSGKMIQVNVGSGFSDENRLDYWVNGDAVIGRTVEVMADAITQNQDGTYSLRFPRFLRFRDDK
jgi:DNA ligase-1